MKVSVNFIFKCICCLQKLYSTYLKKIHQNNLKLALFETFPCLLLAKLFWIHSSNMFTDSSMQKSVPLKYIVLSVPEDFSAHGHGGGT